MASPRVRIILHTNASGEVSTYRVEIPPALLDGDRPIDKAIRSAYLQGFSAGAQYGCDQENKLAYLEDGVVAPEGDWPINAE